MNCPQVRQRLLSSERPERPDASANEHLATCEECRAWLTQLVRLEKAIPQLPVPAVSVPQALLTAFRETEPAVIRPAAFARQPAQQRCEKGRRKVALAFSLAASLALFALGVWAWPRQQGEVAPRPTVVSVEQRFGKERSPAQRVSAASDLARQTLGDVRKRPADIERLADQFVRLVRDDLVTSAAAIPAAERAKVLEPITIQLREAESEALQLAREWEGRREVASLRRMADAARETEQRLWRLVRA